ncbi:hypothetical protein LguiB_007804 [Lonicera macranthoides]
MPRIANQLVQINDFLLHSAPLSGISSASHHFSLSVKESTPSSSRPPSPSVSRISPAVLLLIVILAVIFFISGLLHLLVRFLIKRPSFSSISQSNRYLESSGSQALQRQLQQLFRLHDSGLDQALIDALPVFYYNEIMGLKDQFDCAVCLCEFSVQDKLRLLPNCSHAFHINCIDTWLLSNSTCPLCRGNLNNSALPMENPLFYFNDSREQLNGFSSDIENEFSCGSKEQIGESRVLSVRLGKFKSLNQEVENVGRSQGETSSSFNLDVRRCYSMGSFQYVLADSDLQVALSSVCANEKGGDAKVLKIGRNNENSSRHNGDVEGKKISGRSRGESFSVSKVWLWSNKGKFPNSSDISSLSSNIGQLANITN